MSVLTTRDLELRRAELAESATLQSLGEELRRNLAPLEAGEIYLPDRKALLSRDGGVCPDDGSRLSFDPRSPQRHVCPSCGGVFEGERHHRAWVWRYHLWLSERAIHFALLYALGLDEGGAARAVDVIRAYVERYRSYPNSDNVLGPTRLFFSTYHESIWLLQLMITVGVLEGAGFELDDELRGELQSVADESARLILSFDEWWSNRQVWNNAALIAAGRFLDEPKFIERGVDAPHGVVAQLERAVSADGRWVEGENYHFFALRGFIFAAELLAALGDEWGERLPAPRLGKMYVAPLAGVLPDLTFPARGDSPYGVSLLQPRFAELWELGRVRTGDRRIASVLTAMYQSDAPPFAGDAVAEIAEVESNHPASALRRDRLGWKALLWMAPEPPEGDIDGWKSGSMVLSSAGPGILRPTPDRYIALECGGTGTGHGHPDSLHLSLYDARPWFQDFGTGSYVSESLHWFRSALAHNAPGLVGVGQRGTRGWCSGFSEAGEWSWCQGSAPELFGPEFTARRTLIAGPDYLLDVLDVAAPDDAVIDLPLHPLGEIDVSSTVTRREVEHLDVFGGIGHEHGYDAVHTAFVVDPPPRHWTTTVGGDVLEVLFGERPGETVFLATAQGPPTLDLGDSRTMEFLVRRAAGAGRWVQLYTTSRGLIEDVSSESNHIVVRRAAGDQDRISLRTDGVLVRPAAGESIQLGGLLPEPPARPSGQGSSTVRLRCALLSSAPTLDAMFWQIPPQVVVPLGALNYRRSELDYPGENVFSARVGFCAAATRIYIALDVRKKELVFGDVGGESSPLDNESPDIHADGIQLYVGWDAWSGYLVVPRSDEPNVRVRAVTGTAGEPARTEAEWRRTATGYQMLISCDVGETITQGQEFLVNLMVNEMLPGRERRSGQLALVGGGGWVYLRGDREAPSSAAIAEVR